ncbi:hypothetical protein [Desulforhopalus sp. IMCC35007]|uniref:hypothetical protein n=1 Tax=Desulforhopalus sp. IMCC35007 TaxID=2569543 RepID=UPI0010ADC952|nr:hypothetical protein [Desulforhopalus sp. IMCC35007]TKB08341.1 hypothetical protein FCL48_13475 [Desulforhopalus sp. IMCC35007]
MKSSIITKEKVHIDTTDEIMILGLRTGAVICALIGVWALCSLAAAVIQTGPLAMLRGYLTAITGI